MDRVNAPTALQESPRDRRRDALIVSALTLVAAVAASQTPWRSPQWWAAITTLSALVTWAWRLYQEPLQQLTVAASSLTGSRRTLWRGDVHTLTVLTRPARTGPTATRIVALTADGPASIQVNRLRLPPALLVGALTAAGWPIPGRGVGALSAQDTVRVPTGSLFARRSAFDLALVTLLPAALIATLTGGRGALAPVLVLTSGWLVSLALITAVAAARIGWCVRVTVSADTLTIEDADGVAVINSDELEALGARCGALYLRTRGGTTIRLLGQVPTRVLEQLAERVSAAGHRWEEHFTLTP